MEDKTKEKTTKNDTPENLDDLINKVEEPVKNNKETTDNNDNEKLNITTDALIEMGAGIIRNSYAKVGMEKEGIAKAEIYENINGIILSIIPFEAGLKNIKSVEMKPQTALIIGGASLVISALILSTPALKAGRNKKQKITKVEKEDKTKEADKNG